MDHYNRWVRTCLDGALTQFAVPATALTATIRVTALRVEADLGRFSEAIYNRVTAEAKKQRFQGFRPGTIPPHIEPTYLAFAMDECARETIMEAMQQNNIKPFESARSEFVLENFNIPPAANKKSKKKKIKKSDEAPSTLTEEVSDDTKWRNFATMKEALDAGWRVSIALYPALFGLSLRGH
jgi:Bacterial trigger factor protein (TF)